MTKTISRVQAMDYMVQLSTEKVFAYEAIADTITNIVTALLAFQVRAPAITLGTIAPAYAVLTRSIQVDGDSILKALLALRDTVGGYIEVDTSRRLNWSVTVGENKGQQIRYRKNLAGIERTLDYSQLYNRIYAYGAGEGSARIKLSDIPLHVVDYEEDIPSQGTWGGIYVGVFINRTITHPDTLHAWALQLIAQYKDPPHTYRVDTLDLSVHDGFSFDTLQLGSTVTVIDEDLGISISARVMKIEHPDLLDPQRMILDISNPGKDIVDTITGVYDTQQLESHIATTIGAGQVIVKGAFTVQDWVTAGATTIVGGNIETGTITALQLITTQAVITVSAQIQNAIITSAKIGNLEVKTANLDNLAVTNAKIGNLAVTSAKINDLTADKITAGNLQVTITLTSGYFQTAASPAKRIVISQTQIAGYSDAVTRQFYILASDGKAYFGNGAGILDSEGLKIRGTVAGIGTIQLQNAEGTPRGYIYGATHLAIQGAVGCGVSITSGAYYPSPASGQLDLSAEIHIKMHGTYLEIDAPYMKLPRGAAHPAAVAGNCYYNTTTNTIFYCYGGGLWRSL